MNIVMLQVPIPDEELQWLRDEFPQYLFVASNENDYKKLGQEVWNRVEILFGNKLSFEELDKGSQMRWIHSPFPDLTSLCLDEIDKKGNIIVSAAREENKRQVAEYAMSGVLAFAKNLFLWESADKDPYSVWGNNLRDSLWTLKSRKFLMIGLSNTGTEIAWLAKTMEMIVWGVQEPPSFHPHCHRVFSFSEISSLLPEADVVCVSIPRGQEWRLLMSKTEFELMKNDSILVFIGSTGNLDENALAEVALSTGKFRGIMIDAFYQTPVTPDSKLWDLPKTIITPEIALRPMSAEKIAFRLFCYNLRQYAYGNYNDMRNVIWQSKLFAA